MIPPKTSSNTLSHYRYIVACGWSHDHASTTLPVPYMYMYMYMYMYRICIRWTHNLIGYCASELIYCSCEVMISGLRRLICIPGMIGAHLLCNRAARGRPFDVAIVPTMTNGPILRDRHPLAMHTCYGIPLYFSCILLFIHVHSVHVHACTYTC